jgi:hypothetical protein
VCSLLETMSSPYEMTTMCVGGCQGRACMGVPRELMWMSKPGDLAHRVWVTSTSGDCENKNMT